MEQATYLDIALENPKDYGYCLRKGENNEKSI